MLKFLFAAILAMQFILPQFFSLPGGWGMFSFVSTKEFEIVHIDK